MLSVGGIPFLSKSMVSELRLLLSLSLNEIQNYILAYHKHFVIASDFSCKTCLKIASVPAPVINSLIGHINGTSRYAKLLLQNVTDLRSHCISGSRLQLSVYLYGHEGCLV